MKIVALTLLLGLFTADAVAQELFGSATPGVQICLEAAADFSPLYPTAELPRAREAVAVFALPSDHLHQKLSYTWIAADVGTAAPPNYRIASGELVLEGNHKGALRLSGMKHPLPVGSYRLEVQLDGQPWRQAEFAVVEPRELSEAFSVEQLLPLEAGTVWTYEFLQEAGSGARLELPAEQLDALGRLRSEVTVTLVGRDSPGYQLRLQRGPHAVGQEWWQLDPQGLVITQRAMAGKKAIIDPPQRLWAWPHSEIQTWNYKAANGSFEQQAKQWGPLPVATPRGEKLGYVIRVVRHDPATVSTVERRFVPGVGLISEEIVTALKDGRRVSRQRMTLVDMKLAQQ